MQLQAGHCGRCLLGAAVSGLRMQWIYGGFVYSCPGLTSIREWLQSSKIAAAEAVTWLCSGQAIVCLPLQETVKKTAKPIFWVFF